MPPRPLLCGLCSLSRPSTPASLCRCAGLPRRAPSLSWPRRMPPRGSGEPSRVCLSATTCPPVRNAPRHVENNLLQVKRLVKRTEMRNPDPLNKRYTSLAWAAVLGHEETFEFLLASGHDDHEYSKVRWLRHLQICYSSHSATGHRQQHHPPSPG